jgi:hypothetical protein
MFHPLHVQQIGVFLLLLRSTDLVHQFHMHQLEVFLMLLKSLRRKFTPSTLEFGQRV